MHEWRGYEIDWFEEAGWPECHSDLLKTPTAQCPVCLGTGRLFPVPFAELLPENGD